MHSGPATFCLVALLFFLSDDTPKNNSEKQNESRVKQLLPTATEVSSVQPEFDASQIAQIEKSTGEKVAELLKATKVYKTSARNPANKDREPETFYIAILPVPKLKDSIVAVATAVNGEVAAAQLIKGRTVDLSWKLFLDQFLGDRGLHLMANSLNPPSMLADQSRKGSGGTEEGKRIGALLEHHRLMVENGQLNDRLFDLTSSRGEKATEVAKEYVKLLGKLDGFSGKLGAVLDPADLQAYQERIKDLRKVGDTLASQLAKQEWDKAQQSMRQSQSSCGKCHVSEKNHWKIPLNRAFERQREELGIGRGYFVVGHDLYLPEAVKKDEAQAVANTVKAALWVLKFSE